MFALFQRVWILCSEDTVVVQLLYSHTWCFILYHNRFFSVASWFLAPWWMSWCRTWCLHWSRPRSRISWGSCGRKWSWVRSSAGRSGAAEGASDTASPPCVLWSTEVVGLRLRSPAWTRLKNTGTTLHQPSLRLWPTAVTRMTCLQPNSGTPSSEARPGLGSFPGRSRTPSPRTLQDDNSGGGGRSSVWPQTSQSGCSRSWKFLAWMANGGTNHLECSIYQHRRRGLVGWEETGRQKEPGWWGASAGRERSRNTEMQMRTCLKGNVSFQEGYLYILPFIL